MKTIVSAIAIVTAVMTFAQSPTVPPVVRSQKGDRVVFARSDSTALVNIGKKQQFAASDRSSYDIDINSPKSVTFSADGKLFYVNSLEGCRTVVYDSETLEKKHVINYRFDSGQGPLWAPPSGYYPFTHYSDGQHRPFQGKPVESTWSHGGRYLWVPFYRRTFDLNAQDPSAVAVIDARTHEIVRMFETGPLPKMVATSPDNKYIAVTHWGDNTVGLIDISSDDIADWHHLSPVTVGRKLSLNYSLTTPVNRDSNSGLLLRGTVFTPDSRYLLVSGMAGPMSVIDVAGRRYLGYVDNVYSVRHLAINDGMVYGSCNTAGKVLRFSLDSLYSAIERMERFPAKINLGGKVASCKVGSGARTLEMSPDGRYIFVACNSSSAIYVVDSHAMEVVASLRADSYPVGLAISPDGKLLVSTSQGRKGHGGNAVNLFRVEGMAAPDMPVDTVAAETDVPADDSSEDVENAVDGSGVNPGIWIGGGIGVAAVGAGIVGIRRRRR